MYVSLYICLSIYYLLNFSWVATEKNCNTCDCCKINILYNITVSKDFCSQCFVNISGIIIKKK